MREEETGSTVGAGHVQRQESDSCGVDLLEGYGSGKDDLVGSSRSGGMRRGERGRRGRAGTALEYIFLCLFFCFSFTSFLSGGVGEKRKGGSTSNIDYSRGPSQSYQYLSSPPTTKTKYTKQN